MNSVTLSLLVVLMLITSAKAVADNSIVAPEELQGLAPSIVRVQSFDGRGAARTATGFVWKDTATIVTAYHVVVGATVVEVFYAQHAGGGYSRAFVQGAIPKYDLAILRLKDPKTDVEPLPTGNLVEGDKELIVAGYPLNIKELQSHNLKKRAIQSKTLEGLIGPYAGQLKEIGFPDLSQQVIAVEGGLLPGYSGAPVFEKGKVIGIGDGGLEQGTVNYGWIIPASRLSEVAESYSPPAEAVSTAAAVFYASTANLPDHQIQLSNMKVSFTLVFVPDKEPLLSYFTRVTRLLDQAVMARDWLMLTKDFDASVEQGGFAPITQDSPLAFELQPRSMKNPEFAAFAALKSTTVRFDCYSPGRLDQVLAGLGHPPDADIAFAIRFDYAQQFHSDAGLWLYVSRPSLEFSMANIDISQAATVRSGFSNAALLYGGGCLIKYDVYLPPEAKPEFRENLDEMFAASTFEGWFQPGAGARMVMQHAALTRIGKLSERRLVLLTRFLEYPKGSE
jgi:Trypsin-like peptidase domain